MLKQFKAGFACLLLLVGVMALKGEGKAPKTVEMAAKQKKVGKEAEKEKKKEEKKKELAKKLDIKIKKVDPLTAQGKQAQKKKKLEGKEPEYDKHVNRVRVDHRHEIVFGQSAFISGGFKIYGQIIQNAIKARFLRVNSEGGVQGKMVRLVTLDDLGEPVAAKKNVEIMMKKHNIDMFLGNMGTRSILAVKPLIEKGEIAMLFPWGGEEQLRSADLKYIVNGLGFVEPQIDYVVDHVVETLRINKIALFHADGDFGKQNAKFALSALAKHDITPVSVGSYNRFTMNIVKTADQIIKSDPKIVLCLATSMPTVKLINHFYESGYYGTKFLGIDSTFLVGEILKSRGIPFNYASYVPDPLKAEYQIVKEYRHDIKRFFPNECPNILGLAYYLHAAIVIEAAQQVDGLITKEAIIEKIEKMQKKDIGGFLVNFDPKTRHAYPLQTTPIKG